MRGGRSKDMKCAKLARDAKGRYIGRARRIPPAYTSVCLNTDEMERIEWTGIDKKGRTQYGYSTAWRKHKNKEKYGKLLHTGMSLSRIREWVSDELRKPVASPIAIVVGAVDHCRIRAGATRYTEKSGNRGATTLMSSDFQVVPPMLKWTAKGGMKRTCDIKSSSLAEKLPHMFKNKVRAKQLNKWLSENFDGMTLKDIRTWHANALYVKYKMAGEDDDTSAASAAKAMGHTKTTCRRHYLDPFVIAQTKGVLLPQHRNHPSLQPSLLTQPEQCLIRILERRE